MIICIFFLFFHPNRDGHVLSGTPWTHVTTILIRNARNETTESSLLLTFILFPLFFIVCLSPSSLSSSYFLHLPLLLLVLVFFSYMIFYSLQLFLVCWLKYCHWSHVADFLRGPLFLYVYTLAVLFWILKAFRLHTKRGTRYFHFKVFFLGVVRGGARACAWRNISLSKIKKINSYGELICYDKKTRVRASPCVSLWSRLYVNLYQLSVQLASIYCGIRNNESGQTVPSSHNLCFCVCTRTINVPNNPPWNRQWHCPRN